MQQNKINSLAGAYDAATVAIGGATQHGTAIGLTRSTAAVITGEKNTLVQAVGTLDTAKVELVTRQTTAASILLTAIAFLTLARDLLKPRFGSQYSTAWDVVGFIGSLYIPRNYEGVKFRLQKLIAFLTANVDAQSAEKNITPERAQTILDDVILKQNAVKQQKTVVGNAVKAKKTAFNVVVKRISLLAKELGTILHPLDQIYLSFGLKMPGAFAIPSVPTNVIAVLIGATAVALKWDRSERAERYRVWKKVVGVDAEFVAVGSPADLDFALENLPANATIELAISAVNNGGESMKSELVTVTTA